MGAPMFEEPVPQALRDALAAVADCRHALESALGWGTMFETTDTTLEAALRERLERMRREPAEILSSYGVAHHHDSDRIATDVGRRIA